MNIPTLKMNESPFYWVEQTSPTSFAEPVKMKANVMPTNGDGDIVAYGATFPDFLRIRQSITSDLLKIKDKDKVFWNKPVPTTHSITQSTPDSANYIVTGRPTVTRSIIDIRLKIITGR